MHHTGEKGDHDPLLTVLLNIGGVAKTALTLNTRS